MQPPFKNRTSAGRQLAERLKAYAGREDAIVLALPRGGVPVAFEVATALRLSLDVFVVRKLGVPWQPELAMGAIATGGTRVMNWDVVQQLGISSDEIATVAAEESRELERRERAFRAARPPPAIAGRTVILVDDGIATGSTMRAAAAAIRQQNPARLVIAIPTAPSATVASLRDVADDIVCLTSPDNFVAVGQVYEEFPQVGDEEVHKLLDRSRGKCDGDATARCHSAA